VSDLDRAAHLLILERGVYRGWSVAEIAYSDHKYLAYLAKTDAGAFGAAARALLDSPTLDLPDELLGLAILRRVA
jgi:hypothetical protein